MTASKKVEQVGSGILQDPSSIDLTLEQEALCPAFAAFLREHRTAVGDVLLDEKKAPWTEAEMRDFEEMIKKCDLDDRTVISYLGILYRVAVCWVQRHRTELDSKVELPRAALLIPEIDNPFRMDVGLAFRNHRAWGAWLVSSLEEQKRAARGNGPLSSIVPLLVSAILYGGVWNQPQLTALVRAIPNLPSCTAATANAIYVELALSWQGSGFTEHRSWQPDALTGILLMRTPSTLAEEMLRPTPGSTAQRISDEIVIRRIKESFQNAADLSTSMRLCGLDLLIRSAVCIGYTQMPGVVAAYAHRQFMSQSLSLKQMQRISNKEWLEGLPALAKEGAATGAEMTEGSPESLYGPWWLRLVLSFLKGGSVAETKVNIKKLDGLCAARPLAARLIDYAKSMIFLAPIAKSPEAFKQFLRGFSVLAASLYTEFGGNDKVDPAERDDRELAKLYKRMIATAKANPVGDDLVSDLIGGLKRFHTYLRNCHGKQRLRGKGILAPPALLNRVDVDIISRAEYLEIRRRIRLHWPGRRFKGRREIATGLTVLGAGGLRREEARLLKIGDLKVNGWEGILVQPSDAHTLKSDSARRKVPAEAFPPDDFKRLRDWSETRSEIAHSENGWLFGSDQFDLVSPSIFRALNLIISEVTGTRSDRHSTHFHHLRKAFCSWGLFRLLVPADCQLPDYFSSEDCEWLRNGQNLRPDAIRRTQQPWNSDIFLFGQLLGHLQGRTSLSEYFCFGAELLRVYLSRSAELSPTPEQFRLALGTSRDRENPDGTAQLAMKMAVKLLAKKGNLNPGFAVISSPAGKRSSTFRDEILEAWLLLSAIETADGPIEAAAADLGMRMTRAEAIRDAATYLSEMRSGNGQPRHRFMEWMPKESVEAIRTIVPVRVSLPPDREVIEQFSPRVEAFRKSKSLKMGINAYINHLWDSKGCPVFTQPEVDSNDAVAFLETLYLLEIPDKNIRYGSFDRRGAASRKTWRQKLGLRDRREIESWDVPYTSISEPRPWLGIMPTFASASPLRSPGLFGFRFLMVMACIVLQADRLDERTR